MSAIHLISSRRRIALIFAFLYFAGLTVHCSPAEDDDTALAASVLALAQLTSSGTNNSGSASCAQPGHCKMFATAANAPVMGGITGLDAHCAGDSKKPAGGGTYKALIADGASRIACTTANCSGGTGEHTDWVLKPGQEYRQSDGVTVIGTTTANGVFALPLTAAPDSNVVGFNVTITGLNTDWTSATQDCSNWSTTGALARFGTHDSTTFLGAGSLGCGNTYKVVCVEQ